MNSTDQGGQPYTTIAPSQQTVVPASQKSDDIYCIGMLQSLIGDYGYLPFSISSLRPFCLVHILNDIIVNSRKHIVEFGSGLSTIFIGRMIKKNALNARLVTIENNKGWVVLLNEIIQKEGISDMIDVVYAPLKESPLVCDGNLWYDTGILNSRTTGKQFDMVIVDGPAAWEKGFEMARYPAIPYVYKKLNNRFSIYLDDAHRPGEQAILEKWQKEYGFQFTVTGGTLAYFKTGEAYNTEPIK